MYQVPHPQNRDWGAGATADLILHVWIDGMFAGVLCTEYGVQGTGYRV